MVRRYTKGDKNEVITRMDQVSCITLKVPASDRCMDYLYDGLITSCNCYIDENDSNLFSRIPAIDFFNVVLFVSKCCNEKEISTDSIGNIVGIVGTFENLKYISIIFSDDVEVRDSYDILNNIDSDGNTDNTSSVLKELSNIYHIDEMEIYLGDMFDQKIIDLINKSFISNGIISNSFLERDFVIEFDFEEYVSYIGMFVDNNIDRLSMYDEDIADYLRVFPTIIGDINKPIIKLYTNYREV